MATPLKELTSLRHGQQLLVILMFSLVTIVVWVSISLITSQTKTAIPTELQNLATPLNPSINTEVLTIIEQKRAYDPAQLTQFPIYSLADEQEIDVSPANTLPTTLSSTSSLNSLLAPEPTPSPESSSDVNTAPTATAAGQVDAGITPQL